MRSLLPLPAAVETLHATSLHTCNVWEIDNQQFLISHPPKKVNLIWETTLSQTVGILGEDRQLQLLPANFLKLIRQP